MSLHDSLVEHWAERLLRDGWCIIPDAIGSDLVAKLDHDIADFLAQIDFCRGDFYGMKTKRLGSLLKRSLHAEVFIRHELVLGVVERILLPWCQRIQLNLTQAIEIHPGALPQYPHRDQDMWGGPKGEVEYLVNVMWPLTPFTASNGGTRLWTGSHFRQGETILSDGDAIAAEMAPGTVLLFLGSTLHAGGANHTSVPRRGLVVSYCLGWLKPFELQWLVYPPEVARHFDPELAALIGYAQHRPNLGNVEGQCPSLLLRADACSGPATDALRPDQQAALAKFAESQREEHRAVKDQSP